MRKFGIQPGSFDGRIRVGLIDQNRTRFLGGEDIIDLDDNPGELQPGMAEYLETIQHEDCTDMAIGVVCEYVIDNFDGGLQIAYNNGPTYRINVEQYPDEQAAATAAANELEYAVVADRAGDTVALSKTFDTRDDAEQELAKLITDDYYRDQSPYVADRKRSTWKPLQITA